MIKKVFLIALIPFILCGCSKNSTDEITFSSWGSATEVKIIKNLISDFEKENPSIKVKFMHIPQNYFQKIHLLFASNTPPDVLFVNNLYLPVYASYLEDLNGVFEENEFYKQSLDGLSINNKLFAVPRDISGLVLYVNLDKTTLPDSSWTLDDLMEKCKKIQSQNLFCISYEDKIYWLMPYLMYFGGGVLDNNYNLIIDNPLSKKSIAFYKDLKNKYHYAPTKSEVGSSTQAQMFIDGKIVFYLSGKWMYPKISEKAKFNWAVINFPHGKNPQNIDISGWAISKNTKNKDASIKLVKYLSDKKSSEYFTKTGLITPARVDTSNLIKNIEHNEKVFIDTIEKSKNTSISNDYGKLTDKLNNQLDL